MYNINWEGSYNDYQIFISNSTKDNHLVDAFYAYLVDGLGVRSDKIFNFSIMGRIPPGQPFHDYIRKSILSTEKIAIFFVSKESLKSKYCFYEMGAIWALGILPIVIYISPLRVTDDDFKNLPLTQVQSIHVDLKDKASINNMIDTVKGVICDELGIKETNLSLSIKRKEELIDRILSSPNNRDTSIALKNGITFHENSDSSTLKVLEKGENNIKMAINFTNSIPEFVGYAVNLNNADWSYFVRNNYFINLSFSSLRTVKSMTIEFKGENKNLLGASHIDFSNTESNKISIKLGDLNDFSDLWSRMTELVFLFKPSDIDDMGTIKIENVFLSEKL